MNYRDEIAEIEYEDSPGEAGTADKPEIAPSLTITKITILGCDIPLWQVFWAKMRMEAELQRRIREDLKTQSEE